jgi:endogenous inhibitor of DNA gyrase (YacG/DUF329 family)
MSIKVIKRGEKPADRKYNTTCNSCGSQVEWKKIDAKRVWEGDQRDGPFTQIDCPVCGALLTGY